MRIGAKPIQGLANNKWSFYTNTSMGMGESRRKKNTGKQQTISVKVLRIVFILEYLHCLAFLSSMPEIPSFWSDSKSK